ncbi:unnamed protein product, partial [Darwinula stevensoni]
QKLLEFIRPGPDSQDELIDALADAQDNDVIGAESRAMLEGVIRLADMSAVDVMVPVSKVDFIDIQASYESLLNQVIDTAHSRFPVFEDNKENIIGILLAKDLLKLQRSPNLSLRTLLRPAVFVPESKNLNDLLRDFRGKRNHLAMVVDEYGRIAGLITIEDVLEEIVGEIEDEFDTQEEHGDIFGLPDQSYRINGDALLARVLDAFDLKVQDNDDLEFDTIGGLISHRMGHVPKRGEQHDYQGWRFTVQHTKGGAVKWFKAKKMPTPDQVDENKAEHYTSALVPSSLNTPSPAPPSS